MMHYLIAPGSQALIMNDGAIRLMLQGRAECIHSLNASHGLSWLHLLNTEETGGQTTAAVAH